MALIQSTAIPSGATAYEIEQSLRFNDNDSAYLERTPSSAGNRKTWTFSCWAKRGNIGVANSLFSAYPASSPSDTNVVQFGFTSDDKFQCGFQDFYVVQTNRVFRDASAWYNIVVRIDTTQSTATNRFKVWINGVEETSFSTDGRASISLNQDTGINMSGNPHRVGTLISNSWYYDGLMAEVNFIDGAAKAPADFGETGDYGEWKPIEYSGSYGTNGFYLNFAGAGIMTATGGNSTATDGSYKAASFTADGTFTPSADGFVEYLVVAGGGNGAGFGASSVSGGGGGAGGYRTGYLAVTGGTGYSITVGGAAQNSVFSSITSIAGGNGGANQATTGGSGGGSGAANTSGAAGTSGQGNAGGTGDGNWGYSTTRSGGGGGSGGAGGNASGSAGGAAGAGTANDITGSSVTYAAGGEGVAHTRSTAGTPGAANTGNGGGGTGGSGGNSGGAGGSGIVIIRYKFQ